MGRAAAPGKLITERKLPSPQSSPGDLPEPGIEPGSPALQTDSLPSESQGKPPVGLSLPNNERKTSDSPTHLAFVVLPVGEGWGAVPHSTWDLSSMNRDGTCIQSVEP